MSFYTAKVTITPGENGGPGHILMKDDQVVAGSTTGQPGNDDYWARNTAIPAVGATSGGQVVDREGREAAKRRYDAIVAVIQNGRGDRTGSAVADTGAFLRAMGNTNASIRKHMSVDDDHADGATILVY